MKPSFIWLCFLLTFTPCFAAAQRTAELKTLYDAHSWFRLRDAVRAGKAPAFYQAVVACAFNHLKDCERNLRSTIQSAPQSDQAYEAHEVLVYAYQRAGAYRRAFSEINELLKAKPDAADVQNARGFFSQYPDQTVAESRPSKVRYRIDDGNMFLPVAINGKPAHYMIDTGANFSTISESEAKRLGMTIHDVAAKGSDSTGGEISARTAVADRLEIGNARLRSVPFLVLSDAQQPFVDAAQDQRGILGLPVLVALQTVRWHRDGTFEVALHLKRDGARTPNLCFERGDVLTQAEFGQRKITLLIDTGAETTRLWPNFARDFASIVDPFRKSDSTQVTGVGRSVQLESIQVPEIALRVGDAAVILHPAQVLLKQTTDASRWHHGNLGLDLLNQARVVTIDFKAMTLTLE
jgi:clan AA aspartic protease (TIGR02281 family)